MCLSIITWFRHVVQTNPYLSLCILIEKNAATRRKQDWRTRKTDDSRTKLNIYEQEQNIRIKYEIYDVFFLSLIYILKYRTILIIIKRKGDIITETENSVLYWRFREDWFAHGQISANTVCIV